MRGKRGKGLDEITLEAVVEGRVDLEDLSITTAALRQQAEIARDAGRPTLAQNFERAAELVDVPQETSSCASTSCCGRAARHSREELIAAAKELEAAHGARAMAAFIEEAAEVYERRGLFKKRF